MAIVIARFEVLNLVLNFLLKLIQFQFHGATMQVSDMRIIFVF